MRVQSPQTSEEWRRYYDLRFRILREPWGEARGSERDETDSASYNAMLMDDDDHLVGVARVHFNHATEAQVRYMAIDSAHQHRGCGSLLLAHLEQHAVSNGARWMVLEARESAVDFYERNGYTVTRKSYLLFGVIQHFTMEKILVSNDIAQPEQIR